MINFNFYLDIILKYNFIQHLIDSFFLKLFLKNINENIVIKYKDLF